MLGSKWIEKVIIILTAVALLVTATMVCFPNMYGKFANEKTDDEYPLALFWKDVINIEITADENAWSEMLDNKMQKPYISCDLKIDGKEFSSVGIRPKGNSSLTSIQGDRISYRLDFDHYIENQTCYGLEQMVLNNLQADATYMKDYIAYDLMEYMGVKSPLHTYAFITINGEPFGLYLAVEVYDEDFLQRTYGDTDVKLYNVKSSGLDSFESAVVDSDKATVLKSNGIEKSSGMEVPPGGAPGGNGMGGPGGPPPMAQGGPPPMDQQNGQMAQGGPLPMDKQNGQMAQGGPPQMDSQNAQGPDMAPPGGNGGGGDLLYVDDLTDSYNTIFANAVSDDTDAKDYAKVIRAIKYLNTADVSNVDLEKYWDIDGVLRYLAVHNFMVNGDSYTGNMKQNYYLAERDGQVAVLPWDYNLSFGAFSGGPGGEGSGRDKTTETINLAIDTPLIDADMSERPLVSVLLARDEYKERYHQYMNELIQYACGDFINKLEIIEGEIYPYIERETNSFYSSEEQRSAFEVLKKFLSLRSQSIEGQLNGTIPSETEFQSEYNLVTSDFSIDEMGSMGGPGGGPPEMIGGGESPDGQDFSQRMQPPGSMSGNENVGMPNNMSGNENIQPPNNMVNNGNFPPPDFRNGVSTQNNNVTCIIAIVLLCLSVFGVWIFRRNY